jgi:hypothetical protein
MIPTTNTAGVPVPTATPGIGGVAGSVLGALGITNAAGETLSSASVHGPYEDLGLAALKTLDIVIADAPPAVKQQFWSEFLIWHTGLQNLASKLDFFHLFVAKK